MNTALPKNTIKGLQAMNAGKPLAGKTKADAVEILQRYLSDETSLQIADSLGITRQALSAWLINTAEDEWIAAQIARAAARKDKADDAMDCATDGLELARAREQLKSAQWDLEKLFRRIYGDKIQVDHTVTLDTSDALGAASDLVRRLRKRKERVIDATDAVQHDIPDASSETHDA